MTTETKAGSYSSSVPTGLHVSELEMEHWSTWSTLHPFVDNQRELEDSFDYTSDASGMSPSPSLTSLPHPSRSASVQEGGLACCEHFSRILSGWFDAQSLLAQRSESSFKLQAGLENQNI